MFRQFQSQQILYVAVLLLLCLAAQVERAAASSSSSLSRWLSREALPEITALLDEHPRVAGRTVQLVTMQQSGLDSAVVTVLSSNLGSRVATVQAATARRAGFPAQIDELACAVVSSDAQLRVQVQSLGARKGRVVLALVDGAASNEAWRRWEWQGAFSRYEREALKSNAAVPADGSLSAPWPADAVSEASMALSREFACALRQQVLDRMELTWESTTASAGTITDTFNASRHLLGSLREVDLSERGQLRIQTRVQPFQQDLVQLWLLGEPAVAGADPVQAVTYMRRPVVTDSVADSHAQIIQQPIASPPEVTPLPVLYKTPVSVTPEIQHGPARDFLDVELLGATQSDHALSGADLALQLLLVNRGKRPIEFAFSVSGGHFLDCVARPELFRHDRYGYLEGRLAPGQSLTSVIEIPGVQHRPSPLWGARKCAGFASLEGFENFSDSGYRVTEYLRWGS